MILSIKKKLNFIKSSEDVYTSTHGYEVRKVNGSYFIFKDSKIATWQTGFSCVQCAQDFLNRHDYISATATKISISFSDVEDIAKMYGFSISDDKAFFLNQDNRTFFIRYTPFETTFTTEQDGVTSTYDIDSADALIDIIEESINSSNIFNATMIDKKTSRKIQCASSRDISKNLVRVRSSNLWAYGMNVKDYKNKMGDLVIQFKGREGGPGDVYMYFDVPTKLYQRLLSAPSAGHFFWKYIRNNFKYRKLTGDKKGKLPNAVN